MVCNFFAKKKNELRCTILVHLAIIPPRLIADIFYSLLILQIYQNLAGTFDTALKELERVDG